MITKCKICGKEFYVCPSHFNRGHGRYCSRKCFGISHKGWKPNSKQLEKLSKAHMGQKAWNKGRKFSVKVRAKMSTARKGKEKFMGCNHSMWSGGRVKDGKGYIYIYNPSHPFCNKRSYVFEHRLIIESLIGRYLTPKETSHHLGKKDDNRPEMLMAFSSHSAHRRYHGNPNNVKPEEIIFDGRKYIQ